MKEQNNEIIIVDLKELAQRLNVPLKEVKKALDSGQLKPGIHYIFIGTEIRFQWGQKLIDKLHQTCAAVSEKKNISPVMKKIKTGNEPCIHGRSPFDFSSLQ